MCKNKPLPHPKAECKQNERRDKEVMLEQYECGHSCRICPFPGFKCRLNSEDKPPIQ